MKRTILYDVHVDMGAKMAPFGGFEMPIQYSRITREHMAARMGAAIFDTCHMGEILVKGETAATQLGRLISSDIETLELNNCKNGFLCDENGGVIDDLIAYRMAPDEYMLVVNASSQTQDYEWIRRHCNDELSIDFVADRVAKIDVQGPASPALVEGLIDGSVASLRYYSFMKTSFRGVELRISRTGYTGELGFEIYCANDMASQVWHSAIDAGAMPAGLGARDTLRLEMGMPLHGHELTLDRNAAQSNFNFMLSKEKEYIGAEAVRAQDAKKEKLIAIVFQGRQAARHGDRIVDSSGEEIGMVTSGSYSPCLERAIALGYVRLEKAVIDTPVAVKKRNRLLEGVITKKPFYKKATARHDISNYL